jgi:hypothetical protein
VLWLTEDPLNLGNARAAPAEHSIDAAPRILRVWSSAIGTAAIVIAVALTQPRSHRACGNFQSATAQAASGSSGYSDDGAKLHGVKQTAVLMRSVTKHPEEKRPK